MNGRYDYTHMSLLGLTLSHARGIDAYTYEACPLVQLRPSVLPRVVIAACLHTLITAENSLAQNTSRVPRVTNYTGLTENCTAHCIPG